MTAGGMGDGGEGIILVFTAMLAWIIKTLILRLGGVEAYERLKPWFAGLVVGHFAPNFLAGIMDIVSYIYTGHRLE